MKPRDLLLSRFATTFVPFMEEQGFRFAKRRIGFTRKSGPFSQKVEVALSKWNTADDCEFWTIWGVEAAAYGTWYREEWGLAPPNNGLGGSADWNIPGWTRSASEHFRLKNSRKDSTELQSLSDNALRAGFPFLERISSWHGAAEELLACGWMYSKAADFFLIAGNTERAKNALLLGIRKFEEEGQYDQFGELPDIKKRLQRYF